MKVCLVHNAYGRVSGEEIVVNDTVDLLRENEVEVITFFRSGAEMKKKIAAKAQAFLSGIYNPFSRYKFKVLLKRELPDVVHIHNLFPFISPSILSVCSKLNIPVVMTVHNYRLICPNGLFAVDGQICERCGNGKEYWCIFRNCEGTFFKSMGYAIRTFVARISGAYIDNITVYAALTEFQKMKLVNYGYNKDRIIVIPNMTKMSNSNQKGGPGDYVGYIGRISQEKGIGLLVDVASQCSDIPIQVAGDCSKADTLMELAPQNMMFSGMLDHSRIVEFYRGSRMIIMMSTCYEGFPMTLVEAMSCGKPVICPRIGGLPEIVEHGVTGLLFEPGNAKQLLGHIRYLWENQEVAERMGQAGHDKVQLEYSKEKYFERLTGIYNKAIGK